MDNYQDHFAGLTQSTRLTRRGFAVTSLAAGFAASVRPVSAATITTDSAGLTVGEVKVPVKDGSIPAYRAMPESGSHPPTIVVIHEVFGVHEHIKDLCRRLAKTGYYAIAPQLYAREGDVSTLTDIQEILAILNRIPTEQAMTDMDSAVAFAKTEKADTGKLGVTGFCWGGSRSWLYTAHNQTVKAGAAWYGPLLGRPGAPGPAPIDVAAQIKGRMLGLYAGIDAGITPESRDQMMAALKAAGDTESRIVVFPDAQHGFNADYRPSYNEAAAKDAWAQMLDWFKARGVA